MKIERPRDCSKDLSILRSLPIVSKAGAVMDVDMGEMKMQAEAMMVTRHRATNGQFFGFSASFGPFQDTYNNSTASSVSLSS